MKAKPTLIEEYAGGTKEHHKAKYWRQNIARLSIPQLSELTGYGTRSIYDMENGCNSLGKKIDRRAWQRFRRACQAVHLARGKPFDWA